MPKSWTEQPERCRAAGVPEEVEFATRVVASTTPKIQLARRMLKRASEAGVRAGWYRHITLSLLAHAFLAVMRGQCVEVEKKGEVYTGSLFEFKKMRGLYYR